MGRRVLQLEEVTFSRLVTCYGRNLLNAIPISIACVVMFPFLRFNRNTLRGMKIPCTMLSLGIALGETVADFNFAIDEYERKRFMQVFKRSEMMY